jgi:hypothetical protein
MKFRGQGIQLMSTHTPKYSHFDMEVKSPLEEIINESI